MSAMFTAAVISVAILIDVLLGDPPNRIHPVAWMGSGIAWMRRWAPTSGRFMPFCFGGWIVLGGSLLAAACGWGIERLTLPDVTTTAGSLIWWIAVLIQAIALKCCVGVRSLWRAAALVRDALRQKDLPAARHHLAYNLVSRDVTQLSDSEVSAATIESVAENTSDSVVGPLFYFLIGGLPAALVYRFVNTCDAMLGYRTPQLFWLGKFAARTDDLLNWIPARITAALMFVSSLHLGRRCWQGLQIWRSDAGRTASPNGGHPMSAAAGLLGVCLEKTGHYRLGAGLRDPQSTDIDGMLRLFRRTVIWIVVALLPAVWALQALASQTFAMRGTP